MLALEPCTTAYGFCPYNQVGSAAAIVLEFDADAVASGICDRLFALAADVIVPQAATRRPEGGEVSIRGKPLMTGTQPRCTRRTLEGSTSCERECGGVQEEGRKSRKGMKEAGRKTKVLAYFDATRRVQDALGRRRT